MCVAPLLLVVDLLVSGGAAADDDLVDEEDRVKEPCHSSHCQGEREECDLHCVSLCVSCRCLFAFVGLDRE